MDSTGLTESNVEDVAIVYFGVIGSAVKRGVEFADIADSLFAPVNTNQDESRKLAAMRDYLLPRLLSGEVRVRDVAGTVEETA